MRIAQRSEPVRLRGDARERCRGENQRAYRPAEGRERRDLYATLLGGEPPEPAGVSHAVVAAAREKRVDALCEILSVEADPAVGEAARQAIRGQQVLLEVRESGVDRPRFAAGSNLRTLRPKQPVEA